jgi:hypothetical protein
VALLRIIPRKVCDAARAIAIAALFILAIVATPLALNEATAATARLREYEVKAVFLFNFTQFVEWPETTFTNPTAPFVIGVLGRDPFGNSLDEAVRGETVNGHPLIVHRYETLAALERCQILFIDASVHHDASKALASLERSGTLTVTDGETTTTPDVVIRFLEENNKIRLRINVDSARSAGLTISSKLLRPAHVIGTVGSAESPWTLSARNLAGVWQRTRPGMR